MILMQLDIPKVYLLNYFFNLVDGNEPNLDSSFSTLCLRPHPYYYVRFSSESVLIPVHTDTLENV